MANEVIESQMDSQGEGLNACVQLHHQPVPVWKDPAVSAAAKSQANAFVHVNRPNETPCAVEMLSNVMHVMHPKDELSSYSLLLQNEWAGPSVESQLSMTCQKSHATVDNEDPDTLDATTLSYCRSALLNFEDASLLTTMP